MGGRREAPPYISQFRKRHGLLWSRDMVDPFIDLICWQRYREAPYSSARPPPGGPHEWMLSAAATLFSRRQLSRHRWAERMVRSWTEAQGFFVWLGAGSSGKSHMAGLCVVMDYIASFGAAADDEAGTGENPGSMYGMMVSTSKDALAKRSLASAIEYLGYLRSGTYGVPFKFVANKFAIVPETVNDEQIASVKARIDGVPLQEGSEAEARGKIIGVHLPRIRVIADEFENLSESRANSFHTAMSNLQAGCKDFRCLLLFNPQSRSLPGSRFATPPGGWDKIDLDTYEWTTPSGVKVLRFDGHDSPGVKEPEKYPFLPTQKFIDTVAKNEGGEDSLGYWAFVRAFPPPDDGAATVITRTMVDAWGMDRRVEWEYAPDVFAALDPAFTSGGDDCTLVRGWVGREKGSGRAVICFDPEPHVVPILATSELPALQQIGLDVQRTLADWHIPITNLACDDSGTQSVADYLEILIGRGLYRCNFSAKPPALPETVKQEATVDKRYRNSVTWYHYLLREYAQYGQIKGLPPRAVDELCSRRLDRKLKGLLLIESKRDFKKRNKDGKSPDASDACVMLAGMVRDRFGFVPGTQAWSGPGCPEDDAEEPGDGLAGLALEMNSLHSLESGGRY